MFSLKNWQRNSLLTFTGQQQGKIPEMNGWKIREKADWKKEAIIQKKICKKSIFPVPERAGTMESPAPTGEILAIITHLSTLIVWERRRRKREREILKDYLRNMQQFEPALPEWE